MATPVTGVIDRAGNSTYLFPSWMMLDVCSQQKVFSSIYGGFATARFDELGSSPVHVG